MGVAGRRVFDGKVYELLPGWSKDKRDARSRANFARVRGSNARVVRVRGVWWVYVRRK